MSFQKYTLHNGLRLIVSPDSHSPTTTALFLVEAGSKYETKKTNGISHFLEHLCFKGTAKRPRPIDISSELDALGAQYNAFTGKEYTGYYAKARAEDFERVFDILSDIYLNSTLGENEIHKERDVIIEEINMYLDTPSRQVQELFAETLYGDQPAGWDIAGRKDIIRSLVREDFLLYRSQHYIPKATVLAVAGNCNPRAVASLVKKTFAPIRNGKKGCMPPTKDEQKRPYVTARYKNTDQAHIVLGVRTFGAHDPRRHALTLLANILGGWMSSRLFQKIRVELGAAYYVHAETDFYRDHGYLAVAAGLSLAKVETAIKTILNEFQSVSRHSVSPHELELAKGHVKGSMAIGLETSDEIANFYGTQEITRKNILTVDQIWKKVDAVQPDDIHALARSIFKNNRLNLAVIGPYKTPVRFQKLLSL